MKRSVITITLALFVLSGSALAGDMPTGGYAPPDPGDATETSQPAQPAAGDVPTGDQTEADFQPMLTLLMTIVSLLS